MINEKQVISVLDALAQETRLQIVRYLVRCGADGSAAGTIANELGVAASRLSFHLSTLEHAGVIGSTKVSRSIIYRVNYENLGSTIAYLLEDCCGNNPQILACCTSNKNCE